MKGASASLARRRAISVLPTPVGPIIRMFFGVISPRSFSSTCWRRQRLRNAIATARFALAWPTMWRSNSETISCGVMLDLYSMSVQRLDDVVLVRVDAEFAGNLERFLDDFFRRELGVRQQCPRARVRIRAARADRDDAMLRFEHIAVAGDDQRRLAVRDGQHRLEAAQSAVGAPVLREL